MQYAWVKGSMQAGEEAASVMVYLVRIILGKVWGNLGAKAGLVSCRNAPPEEEEEDGAGEGPAQGGICEGPQARR